VGKTQEKIEKLVADFNLLDLDQKLLFLYSESLYNRYSDILDHEFHQENNPLDEYDYEQIEQDFRDMRIENLEFTYEEVLFLFFATGMWDGMVRNHISLRLAMTILALICDKKNPQVFQNAISRTRQRGALDSDWMLNKSQEAEFFAKLEGLEDPSRVSPLVKYLNTWLLQRRRSG
jgi:hypothetical protein